MIFQKNTYSKYSHSILFLFPSSSDICGINLSQQRGPAAPKRTQTICQLEKGCSPSSCSNNLYCKHWKVSSTWQERSYTNRPKLTQARPFFKLERTSFTRLRKGPVTLMAELLFLQSFYCVGDLHNVHTVTAEETQTVMRVCTVVSRPL